MIRVPRRSWRALTGVLALAGVGASWSGCDRPPTETLAPTATRSETPVPTLDLLRAETVGSVAKRPPWIAHVVAADLDRDGRVDIIACEAQENQVLWLRQTAPGVFQEHVIGDGLKAPVHAEVADIDSDGDLDVMVASMGYVFPNNDRIGSVFVLENDGRQQFTRRVVLENTSRVTDVRAADLNEDGRVDLVLAQFGYDQGEVAWLERTGPWTFRRHVLLELSGAINVGIADFNADQKPDLVAIVSQQWEEIYYFENTGAGFRRKRIWGSTNEDFGSSGMTVADLNRDGRSDIVFTSGDGFGPAATPGPRPWHGVHWLENTGGGQFRYRRIGTLPGAYSPVVTDLDGDGAVDIVAAAAYADWNNKDATVISLMWFRNNGPGSFVPHILAHAPKDQITVAAGEFDGSGKPALVTGGFYIYPPYDGAARLTLWRR